MKVYIDNAATTPLDKEVIDAMHQAMQKHFGNPSSIHAFGRESRVIVENARKTIANLLNVSPAEIFFTSCGTEANNMAIRNSIKTLGLKHAITTRIEHHSVLHTLEFIAAAHPLPIVIGTLPKGGETHRTGHPQHPPDKIKLHFVNLKSDGHVDLDHLEELLRKTSNLQPATRNPIPVPNTLVSLMHANNEIGNLLPIEQVGEMCEKYNAVFHSDTVQTMGHYALDLQKIKVHFISCSPHKFHGPKGVGFLYINGNIKIDPLIYGGPQERNMRGGTENIYGIAGLAKAFELAHRNMGKDQKYIQGLKTYMISQLEANIPGVQFNGDHLNSSLYTVLNVSLPPTDKAEMLLFNLDIAGIAASGGSACVSGSTMASHVLEAIGCDANRPPIRFSFSKFNTKEEIDYCVEKLKELI